MAENKSYFFVQSVHNALKEKTLMDVIKNSYKNFNINHKFLGGVFLCIISIYVNSSYYFFLRIDKVEKIIELSNTIIMALLAVVVTGYAIFQALSSKTMLLLLFNTERDLDVNESIFSSMQHKCFFLSFAYVIIIGVNYCTLLCLYLLPSDIIPYKLVILCLSIFNSVVLYGIFEMIWFIFNLYQFFKIVSLKTISNSKKGGFEI